MVISEKEQRAHLHNIRVVVCNHRSSLDDELSLAGFDRRTVRRLCATAECLTLLLEDVEFADALALKEEMVAVGGGAGLSESLMFRSKERGSVVLMGAVSQFRLLVDSFSDDGSRRLIAEACLLTIENYFHDRFRIPYHGGELRISGRPLIMGVLNVTPDSFYDGRRYMSQSAAVKRGLELVDAGADIIDVGGESTRPGAEPVTAEEEKRRILGVISTLARQTDVPICVDTYKAEVADAALRAGARMVNDITGLHAEPAIGEIMAQHGAPLIVMHIKGKPRDMQVNPTYRNIMSEVSRRLRRSLIMALNCGIPKEQIIVDPGIGFGKSYEHNLILLNRIGQFRSLGCPVLVGVSRKSFIGAVTGRASPSQRLPGTVGACVTATMGGASILRVHDPEEVRDAVLVARAVQMEKLNVAT